MLSTLATEPEVRLPGELHDEFRLMAEAAGVEVPVDLINKLEDSASA